MKDFVMKFDEEGKPTFFDEKDRGPYRALLSSISKNSSKFVMTISVYNPKDISDNQIKLFRVLVNLIANESGNDIKTVEETLIKGFRNGIECLEDLSKSDFSMFLEYAINLANEIFDLNITQNSIGNLEIKNNR